MSWDWSKEDNDVVAVLSFNVMPDSVFKEENGITYIKSRNNKEYISTMTTLDTYKKQFGDRLHIRPKVTKPEESKPEWTIYNNELPFGDLTDEQKGALMVASLGTQIVKLFWGQWRKMSEYLWRENRVYRAKKPEPTILEQLIADLPAVYDSYDNREALAQHLIDKGWHK